MSERASDPTLARAARAGDQEFGGIADPGAVAEAEHEAAVEPAGAAQIDILEAGVLVAQLSLLEAPLEGPGSAFGYLSVDQQREPVLERHVAETWRAICSRKAASMPGWRSDAMRWANGCETALSVICRPPVLGC